MILNFLHLSNFLSVVSLNSISEEFFKFSNRQSPELELLGAVNFIFAQTQYAVYPRT